MEATGQAKALQTNVFPLAQVDRLATGSKVAILSLHLVDLTKEDRVRHIHPKVGLECLHHKESTSDTWLP
jgi:hypothetical protein